jgi:hypothetical protein
MAIPIDRAIRGTSDAAALDQRTQAFTPAAAASCDAGGSSRHAPHPDHLDAPHTKQLRHSGARGANASG